MTKTNDQITNLDAELDALSSPTTADTYVVSKDYDPDVVAASAARRSLGGGGGGGGLTLVSCVLARDSTGIDIHAGGNHPILWDNLYDNLSAFNTPGVIPDGLGLDFDFDGSSDTITTTEAGTWAFTYNLSRASDDNWEGNITNQFAGFIWDPATLLSAAVVAFPSGVSLSHNIFTSATSAADPYNTLGIYLAIVRLG